MKIKYKFMNLMLFKNQINKKEAEMRLRLKDLLIRWKNYQKK